MADTSNASPGTIAPPAVGGEVHMTTFGPGDFTGPPAAGLINTPPPGVTTPPGSTVTGYTPAQATAGKATATGYGVTPYTVDPNATVAGQIKDIIASGSPLLQQAEAGARATMNARGLINSTDAITAGQSAVIGAALPIAQADAATFNQAATNTMTAKNAEAGSTAQATNVAGLQNSQLETQNSQFNAGQTNASLSQASTASNQQALQALRRLAAAEEHRRPGRDPDPAAEDERRQQAVAADQPERLDLLLDHAAIHGGDLDRREHDDEREGQRAHQCRHDPQRRPRHHDEDRKHPRRAVHPESSTIRTWEPAPAAGGSGT
jgi:hypothetical protein